MEKNRIRVFIIGYSANKGGVEAYISNLNDNIDHREFEVIYQLPEMIINGRRWVAPQNRHNYIKYRLFWLRFFQDNHFDVLYLNTCDIVSIDPLKFAKKAGIPVRIIHSHSIGNQQEINNSMSLFHKITERRNRKNLDKYATHLFACSEIAGKWMFGKNKSIEIIKNGINIKKYAFNLNSRVSCRKSIDFADEPVIGVIGRLDPVKNPLFALDILERTIKHNNCKAMFIGNGMCRSDLENAVKERGLEKDIVLTGAVDNVHEWMSAIDCLFMPSLFEGLPFVLVEAQAAGLHCVVSSTVSEEANITGLIDYVSLNDDPDIWVEHILKACESPRKDESQKLINAGYSIKKTTEHVSALIQESLKSRYEQ